jgi:hypothetical protein
MITFSLKKLTLSRTKCFKQGIKILSEQKNQKSTRTPQVKLGNMKILIQNDENGRKYQRKSKLERITK